MKHLQLLLAVMLLASCRNGKEDIYEVATMSDRVRLEITSDGSLNHLDLLMNKEVTDMSMPWVNEGVAEMYLERGGTLNIQRHHIFKAMAMRQAGDYVNAYDHILAAQRLSAEQPDDYMIGMIWLSKYLMSQYMQDYQTAIGQALKAYESFEKAGDFKGNYLGYLLEAIRGYVLLGRYDAATSFMNGMEEDLEELSPVGLAKYYDTQLIIYRATDKSKLPDVLTEIRSEIEDQYIYWLNVAYTYSLLGQQDEALRALDNYLLYNQRVNGDVAYHGVRAHIMERTGRHDEALESHKRYIAGVEEEFQELLDSDMLLKEQQNEAEITVLNHRHQLVIAGLSVLILLLVSLVGFLILRHRLDVKRKEVAAYSELMMKAEEEIGRLKEMYENKTLDKDLRDALIQRMEVFNRLTLSKISPNFSSKEAEEELRALIAAKDTFLESTCRTFEALHPGFTVFLASCNLTERERGCCCLYCMGMRGNEIAAYMGLADQSYYNFSSIIRKKLGLKEYKTNLDFFLRDKMAELDS